MKRLILLFAMIFVASLHAQDDRIEFDFHGDSLTIWHYQTWQNCGANYVMDLQIEGSTIYLMENDTSSEWATCMCYFDLAVTLKTSPSGQYSLIIHTTNKFIGDTTFVADTTLLIDQVPLISFSDPECVNMSGGIFDQGGMEIPLTDHYESGCQSQSNSALYASSDDKNVHLVWYIDSINCDIKPDWQGFLENDTFQVIVTDTGIQNNCSCPQYLTATFGPFPSGKYTLDFKDGKYGYPVFIVNEKVTVETDQNELILNWDVADLNCCLKTLWEGWLEENIFHVTMTDTGAPCDCLCPFELSARFGPFQPGTYILDFINSQQEQIEFTIGGTRKGQTLATASSYQSDCYYLISNEPEPPLPAEYTLLRSYPNPFNLVTTIEFCLPRQSDISIDIYNINGAFVENLYSGNRDAGIYSIKWNASRYPSGIYFVRLNSGYLQLINKLLLLK